MREVPHGTLALAEEQTAGRGRSGRSWHSPPGLGLYVSLLLRADSPLPPELVVPALTLCVPVCLARALAPISAPAAVTVKWPNDILVAGGKCAGILLETVSEGGRVGWVVLGIGVNVSHQPGDFPADIDPPPVSLRIAAGRDVAREQVLSSFLREFDPAARLLTRPEGVREILLGGWSDEYRALCPMARGRRVLLLAGADPVEGVTEGIDAEARLLVRFPDGVRALATGEVREVRPEPPR